MVVVVNAQKHKIPNYSADAADLAYQQWHSPRKPMHHTCEGEQ